MGKPAVAGCAIIIRSDIRFGAIDITAVTFDSGVKDLANGKLMSHLLVLPVP